MRSASRIERANQGGILLTVLVFAVVIATMLAGLGSLIISFYSRVTTESQYASAINLADAGANYEFRKINQNVTNADLQSSATNVSMGSGTFSGTFKVYCTMADGVTAWDKSTVPFYVVSTGTIGSVSRSIKVNATNSTNSGGPVGVFAVVSGDTSIANGTPVVNGNVATDGTLDFTGHPVVSGNVTFYGPSAGWNPSPGNAYTTVVNPTAVVWPTTSAVALSLFPISGATAPGGLSYLSVHNDNALSSPAITGNSLNFNGSGTFTFNGKAGGANYYVTSMIFNGSPNVVLNNTAGPITIWQGTTNGTLTLNGGVATVAMSTDPSKAVRFYAATTSGVTLNGTGILDAGVYNVTGGTATTTLNGTGTVDGSIICDKFIFNGNTTVNATSGYYSIPGASTYSFNNSYSELNGY